VAGKSGTPHKESGDFAEGIHAGNSSEKKFGCSAIYVIHRCDFFRSRIPEDAGVQFIPAKSGKGVGMRLKTDQT
jgi:hypothetical protein